MFKGWPSTLVACLMVFFFIAARPALGVHPFITDDARVVGRQAQMETWARGDRPAFQYWALTSYGPIEPLELTIGAMHGATYDDGSKYSIAGPLMHAKYFLRTPEAGSRPGVAVSAGAFAPVGNGAFKPHGWDTFSYAAVTESLTEGDSVLIHGKVRLVNSSIGSRK